MIKIIMILVLILVSPLAAGADTITWDSGTFSASTASSIGWNTSVEDYLSPPLSLPLSANAYSETNVYGSLEKAYANSDITNSSFYIDTGILSLGSTGTAQAEASFNGSFTSVSPTYRFSYNMSQFAAWGQNTWITITDLTSGTTLFNSTLQSGSNYIDIATPSGHSIEVDFGISQSMSEYRVNAGGYTSLSFDTISIVPEPISSALFITGGTLFAARRVRKRGRPEVRS